MNELFMVAATMAKKKLKVAPVEADTVTASEGAAPDASEGESRVDESVMQEIAGKIAAPAPTPHAFETVQAAAQTEYVETDRTVIDLSNSKSEAARQKAKLLSRVGSLGKDYGNGKKSLVALVEVVVEAAADGVIATDDAERIYTKFRKEAAEKAGLFAAAEQANESLKVQVSKLRKIIEVSKAIDRPWDMFEMARDMHVQAMQGDDKQFLRVKSTYEAMVNVAREQTKDSNKGITLTEEQIHKTLFKDETEKKETTGLDIIKQALKLVTSALDGKEATADKPARDPIAHDNLIEAEAQLKAVINELDPEFFPAQEKAKAEAEAKAKATADKLLAAAGYSRR